MDDIRNYPENCRKNIGRLTALLGADCRAAYAMMLLTATLMDLDPADPKVADIILDDCIGRKAVTK